MGKKLKAHAHESVDTPLPTRNLFDRLLPIENRLATILGNDENPPDSRALNDVAHLWLSAIQDYHERVRSGQPVRYEDEPRGLPELTYFLASICDIGPTSIDPTPLIRCFTLLKGLQAQSTCAGRNGQVYYAEDEKATFGEAINQAASLVLRMVYAWVALGPDNYAIESDGPCGINQWRYDGNIVEGEMTLKPWKLAKYLFERLGTKVPLAELKRDHATWGNTQTDSIRRHISYISTWFADRNPAIPLTVESADKHIWMKRVGTEQ